MCSMCLCVSKKNTILFFTRYLEINFIFSQNDYICKQKVALILSQIFVSN
jgi:hypothetical protein